jgi:phage major head subunit gpT-like protein
MLITPSSLDALFIGFSQSFSDAYVSEPTPLTEAIGTKIPSSTRDQRYPFVQAISGAMRQWQGERQVQNVVVDGFTVTNKKWENTLAIAREDVEDDQYGVYTGMLIPNLARHAKLLPDQEIAAAIAANAVGFDGKAFFAADHPVDPSGATSGTNNNIVTSAALSGPNLARAQARLMKFLGPDGLPMGNVGDTILVPPSLKYVAETLAHGVFYPGAQNGNSSIFGAQSNLFIGQYKVVCSPWITDSGDPATATWYLLDCRHANMRPFFWQEREAAQLVSMVDPANPVVFMQDNFYMGARARGAAAGALYFKAVKCTA